MFFVISCKAHDWQSIKSSVIEQKPELFNSSKIKITNFSIIGNLTIQEAKYIVASCSAVTTGMLSPRGHHYLLILNSNNKIVKFYNFWSVPRVLWCEGSKIYLFGKCSPSEIKIDQKILELTPSDEMACGNVIEFKEGINYPILTIEKAYGSSGGIEDDPWKINR